LRPGFDATHLIARTLNDYAFYRVPLDGGAMVPLEPRPAEIDRHVWTVRNGAIYGARSMPRYELVQIDAATGAEHSLGDTQDLNWRGGVTVSPDGKQIVLSRTLLQESDLNLVELK
jgi:hypothetical protein